MRKSAGMRDKQNHVLVRNHWKAACWLPVLLVIWGFKHTAWWWYVASGLHYTCACFVCISLWLNYAICAFDHCSNSIYTVNCWSTEVYQQCKIRQELCSCQRPFTLFSFLSEKKDPDTRKKRTNSIIYGWCTKRKKLDYRVLWQNLLLPFH